MTEITPQIVADHGLSEEEYQRVLTALGREPTPQEVAHEMQLPVHKVSRLLAVVREPAPLEGFGSEGEGLSAIHQVADAASAVVLPPAISKLDAPKRPQKALSSASSQTVPMWGPNA